MVKNLDPRELRLGNLVENIYGTSIQVIVIDDTIDWGKAIPLTFEWLRKFGFVLNDIGEDPTETEKRYRHAYKGSFGIEFDTQKGTFTLHNVVGELVEYQYVHHLQNVYYWNTMKELEIKDIDPQNVHKIS